MQLSCCSTVCRYCCIWIGFSCTQCLFGFTFAPSTWLFTSSSSLFIWVIVARSCAAKFDYVLSEFSCHILAAHGLEEHRSVIFFCVNHSTDLSRLCHFPLHISRICWALAIFHWMLNLRACTKRTGELIQVGLGNLQFLQVNIENT